MTQLQLVTLKSAALPAIIEMADEPAQLRFFEFFTANIRNRNTRRAYGLAVREFLRWCEQHRVSSIAAVAPVHVAGYIEQRNRERSADSKATPCRNPRQP